MKKFLIVFAVMAAAAVATVAMVSRSELNSLFEANIEALALGESELGSK